MNKEAILAKIAELAELAEREGLDLGRETAEIARKLEAPAAGEGGAWRRVELARMPDRPGTLEYARRIFDDFMELRGDRAFGDDPALVGGIGLLAGRAVTFLGHQKGRNMKENLARNFGMPHPEGYRKALRLARQAEKFGRPILAFLDTPGAFPGVAAEERGISEAIARNLKEFSVLRVPVVVSVIGEGGSGGAIGIGVGDVVLMLENAYYSVITPEGCASILMRDASKARESAELLKLTAPDLLSLGVIDRIVKEPQGGAHADPDAAAAALKAALLEALSGLSRKTADTLVAERQARLLGIGVYRETEPEPRGILQRLMAR